MHSIGERLRAHWSAQGVRFRPGVPEEVLTGFEATQGVRLPPDLRDYFSTVDGMDSNDETNPFGWDVDLFRFWPLEEVERATECYLDRFLADQPSFFVFADHSISLPSYAIRLTSEKKGNVVLAIYSDLRAYEAIKVADSFTEFVERYLADRDSRLDLGVGVSNEPQKRLSEWLVSSRHPLWDPELDR